MTPSRLRRGQERWVWLAVLAGGLVLVTPGHAEAQLNPCGPQAPAPRRPDTGMPGWFASAPRDPPPTAGAATAPEDLFATYGTAGLWWPTWDLGCSGAAEGIVTDMANLPMDWMAATLNGTASVRAVAWEDNWLGPVDQAAGALGERLGEFFATAMGLAMAALGVWMLYRARTAEYGEITTAAVWAVVLMAVAALALSYPAWAGRAYDDAVIGSARLVNDALAGDTTAEAGTDPAVAQINGDVAYRVWLRGMFGADSTATAEAFGPRFYAALAFAWSELPTLDAGGAEAQHLVEAHQRAFVDAARELEAVDPNAYRTLQGKGAFSTRIPTGLVGWILVGALCVMAGLASVLVLVARLVGRGLVMALPVVAPFGALYRWSGPVRKLAGIAQAVAVALITATVAGGLLTRGVGALLSSEWPLWLVGVLALVAAYAALRAMRPVGTMAGLVGLGGLSARLPHVAVGALATRWGARSGAREGVAEGLVDDGRTRSEDFAAAPPEDHSTDPLPPATIGGASPRPTPAVAPADRRYPAVAVPPAVVATPRALGAAPRPPAALPTPAESRPAPPPDDGEREPDVWDAHLVVGPDGTEVYEVYQRGELASR